MMRYLFLSEEGFGFKSNDINEISDTDIPISEEVYQKFFEMQSQGKQFRVLNPNGTTFPEMFEEIAPIIDVAPIMPTDRERIEELENLMNLQLLGVL